jgi:uncharacterized protein
MAIKRLSIFPLSGAILFPGLQLPLHIFEPRYRALVSDTLIRDRLIGMVQPREAEVRGGGRPALFDIGCVGRIADVEASDDGRYNIVLEGVQLFRILAELDTATAYRQVEAELIEETEMESLSAIERAALDAEAKRFAIWLGYRVDWDGVAQLDDTTFVNAIAQIAPFDVAGKQALLEAPDLSTRAELIMQLMRFVSTGRDPGDNRATLQ